MIHFELTADEAKFLAAQLADRRRHIENELVHTDKRSMQADIARDLERVEVLYDRLFHTMTLAATDVAV